ncbi:MULTISPECIES: GNAT family N-acetyltransferase [unclassified Aerococcus]|uniref:GNAT family N-acetyltransferase n=1 Tax=unclassified Aerococcus TaxID=2618060 RepID=UPI0008A206A5|nr:MULTISPECIES: GNAT family N-acetyltransferase [unclassified Aerococcus]MDK6370021.1 N-acetyltransferase family protein [Aerococcus sp. UMB9870]MDK6678998.1 N-acetyltransferase family protein [Aerococcus sp. UMB8608]MDK6687535.1 N-acetyltransferase family protein [Aerococcus sp. UMB8623]MDK6939657.1 N-acetyltransferase family protein [Aerococcus sp. UMB8487]
MADIQIRHARLADCERLAAIYRPYVEETTISFEYEAPDTEEMAQRLQGIQAAGYPYLVAEYEGEVWGYAYAHQLGDRQAFQHSAELSIYADRQAPIKGIGYRLFQDLETELKQQGIVSLVAVITASNQRSLAFHERQGFYQVGLLPKVGYKFEQWLDTAYLYKEL